MAVEDIEPILRGLRSAAVQPNAGYRHLKRDPGNCSSHGQAVRRTAERREGCGPDEVKMQLRVIEMTRQSSGLSGNQAGHASGVNAGRIVAGAA
jgi:hypothetical protein